MEDLIFLRIKIVIARAHKVSPQDGRRLDVSFCHHRSFWKKPYSHQYDCD